VATGQKWAANPVSQLFQPSCPHCQHSVVTRNGHDRQARQRFTCTDCGRDFTIRSASAFSGHRWPADVILMAVRWYLRHPLSATSVMELLAERGIDVSNRTVPRRVHAFGPQLAAEARKHRRPLGSSWYTDELFFFCGQDKWYLYRAVDEHGQVVDILLREHRDTESAEAFFQQALGRSGQVAGAIITDARSPALIACAEDHDHRPVLPGGFECLRALRSGHVQLADVLPTLSASASRHDHARTVAAAAVLVLGMRLNGTPRTRR
jgi:transposase-like protein/predicted RNA-binding Zn-ribbon protein involved in translation (DUF1610 family)